MATRLLAQGVMKAGFDSQSILDFEEVFSSDYPAYEIYLDNVTGVSDNQYINANLIDANGSVLSNSTYNWQGTSIRDSGTTQTSVVGSDVALWSVSRPSGATYPRATSSTRLIIASPFESTSFTTFMSEVSVWYSTTAYFYHFAGNYKNAVSCTGIRFSSVANTSAGSNGLVGGRVRIYGMGA